MSYHPPLTHQDFSVGYYPPPNPGAPYNNQPAPFLTDQYGKQGFYPPPGQGEYPPPGQYPPPGGQYPPPGEQYPHPGGQYPPPGGQYPPPGEQYPPPGGQYPPPGEQYPPPGGQYPPPGGQYAPPGGQYAPPQPYGQHGYGGEPVPNQPMQGDWTSINQGFPNTPPGLESLIPLSHLFVKQKVELLEVFTGFETNNKYTIKNERGDKLFWAMEDSNMCNRMIFGRARPFEISVVDAQQREVIRLSKALRCSYCCCPCCLQVMEVFAPPGNLLGTIEQDWSILYPRFRIKDVSGTTVLKIKGPFLANPCFGVASFKVLSKDGEIQVGKIKKDWSGIAREMFTDADTFGISFPMDLDVRMKAVVLGAVFLIDALYFEK